MAELPNNFQRFDGRKPRIGVTMDVSEDAGRVKVDCSLAYALCVHRAGGVPVLLPPLPELVSEHVALCDGLVLTGGDDPKMEPFGVPTHPEAKVIHPIRQEYELQLLSALERQHPETPVLGICLGMQLMALHGGGTLNQFLPETLATHALHKKAEHPLVPIAGSFFGRGLVWSNHRQAVDHPGRLNIVARSPDGLIEAVTDPDRAWFLGVQWHPERTSDSSLGLGLFSRFIQACDRR